MGGKICFKISEEEIKQLKERGLETHLNAIYKKIINIVCIDSFLSFDENKTIYLKYKYENFCFNKFIGLESILISKYNFAETFIKQSINEVKSVKEIKSIKQIIMDFSDFEWEIKLQILLWMTVSLDKNIQYIGLSKLISLLINSKNENLFNQISCFYKKNFKWNRNNLNSSNFKNKIFCYLIYSAILNIYFYLKFLKIDKLKKLFNFKSIFKHYKNYYSYKYVFIFSHRRKNKEIIIKKCKEHDSLGKDCLSNAIVGTNFYYDNYSFLTGLWAKNEYGSDCKMIKFIEKIQKKCDQLKLKNNVKHELNTYEKTDSLFFNTKNNLNTWLTACLIDASIFSNISLGSIKESDELNDWDGPINLFYDYRNLVIKQKVINNKKNIDFSLLQNLKIGDYYDFKKRVVTFLKLAIQENFVFVNYSHDRKFHNEGYINLTFCESFYKKLGLEDHSNVWPEDFIYIPYQGINNIVISGMPYINEYDSEVFDLKRCESYFHQAESTRNSDEGKYFFSYSLYEDMQIYSEDKTASTVKLNFRSKKPIRMYAENFTNGNVIRMWIILKFEKNKIYYWLKSDTDDKNIVSEEFSTKHELELTSSNSFKKVDRDVR